jgi:carboxypeptidase Q
MRIPTALVFGLCLSAFAAEKPKSAPAPPMPTVETLDLDAIARIRDEGLNHSHIMEYASGLFDGVGPRLTGSPDFAKAAQWSLEE